VRIPKLRPIVVADDEKVALGLRKQPDEAKLRRIDILKLVDA
jgi:hypothetical protein